MTDIKVEVRSIPLDSIIVDYSVQRKFSETWAAELERTWDDAKAGIISVSARDDGTFHITDGQTRLQVMRRQGKQYADAVVVYGLDHAGEAEAFLGHARSRPVQMIEKFLIAVEAEREPELSMNKLLAAHGWGASLTASGAGQFKAVQKLRSIAVASMAAADNTLWTVTQAWGNQYEAAHGNLISGIGRLYLRRDPRRQRLVDVLRKTTPEGFRASADVLKAKTVPAVSVMEAYADQAVRMYNAGLREGGRLRPFI